MVNTKMLISKMKLYGDRQEDLAEFLGISLNGLNAKIHNKVNMKSKDKKRAEFKQTESNAIRIRYNLTAEEYVAIFCTQSVHCEGTEANET